MNDKLIRKMYGAAVHRLEAAEDLEQGHPLDSLYLAGYAIECSLKALILSQTPKRSRQKTFTEEFRGSVAHDFESLNSKLRLLKFHLPKEQLAKLRIANAIWSVDLRYESKLPMAKDLAAVLEFAKSFCAWVKERI